MLVVMSAISYITDFGLRRGVTSYDASCVTFDITVFFFDV